MDANERAALINELRLTMDSTFVPWSKSRNAKEKDPSLNWLVTIFCDGRPVLTTDYTQGCGHTAAYKASVANLGAKDSIGRHDAVKRECQTGRDRLMRRVSPPAIEDVLYSLVSDADVLNSSSFEDWANELGYDPDSRKAESIYRACLEIALKLRNGIGESNLARLREAFEDF